MKRLHHASALVLWPNRPLLLMCFFCFFVFWLQSSGLGSNPFSFHSIDTSNMLHMSHTKNGMHANSALFIVASKVITPHCVLSSLSSTPFLHYYFPSLNTMHLSCALTFSKLFFPSIIYWSIAMLLHFFSNIFSSLYCLAYFCM